MSASSLSPCRQRQGGLGAHTKTNPRPVGYPACVAVDLGSLFHSVCGIAFGLVPEPSLPFFLFPLVYGVRSCLAAMSLLDRLLSMTGQPADGNVDIAAAAARLRAQAQTQARRDSTSAVHGGQGHGHGIVVQPSPLERVALVLQERGVDVLQRIQRDGVTLRDLEAEALRPPQRTAATVQGGASRSTVGVTTRAAAARQAADPGKREGVPASIQGGGGGGRARALSRAFDMDMDAFDMDASSSSSGSADEDADSVSDSESDSTDSRGSGSRRTANPASLLLGELRKGHGSDTSSRKDAKRQARARRQRAAMESTLQRLRDELDGKMALGDATAALLEHGDLTTAQVANGNRLLRLLHGSKEPMVLAMADRAVEQGMRVAVAVLQDTYGNTLGKLPASDVKKAITHAVRLRRDTQRWLSRLASHSRERTRMLTQPVCRALQPLDDGGNSMYEDSALQALLQVADAIITANGALPPRTKTPVLWDMASLQAMYDATRKAEPSLTEEVAARTAATIMWRAIACGAFHTLRRELDPDGKLRDADMGRGDPLFGGGGQGRAATAGVAGAVTINAMAQLWNEAAERVQRDGGRRSARTSRSNRDDASSDASTKSSGDSRSNGETAMLGLLSQLGTLAASRSSADRRATDRSQAMALAQAQRIVDGVTEEVAEELKRRNERALAATLLDHDLLLHMRLREDAVGPFEVMDWITAEAAVEAYPEQPAPGERGDGHADEEEDEDDRDGQATDAALGLDNRFMDGILQREVHRYVRLFTASRKARMGTRLLLQLVMNTAMEDAEGRRVVESRQQVATDVGTLLARRLLAAGEEAEAAKSKGVVGSKGAKETPDVDVDAARQAQAKAQAKAENQDEDGDEEEAREVASLAQGSPPQRSLEARRARQLLISQLMEGCAREGDASCQWPREVPLRAAWSAQGKAAADHLMQDMQRVLMCRLRVFPVPQMMH